MVSEYNPPALQLQALWKTMASELLQIGPTGQSREMKSRADSLWTLQPSLMISKRLGMGFWLLTTRRFVERLKVEKMQQSYD